MKRAGNLFESWCNVENFYEALKEVRKGKTLHDTFIAFESKAPVHIEKLVNEIKSQEETLSLFKQGYQLYVEVSLELRKKDDDLLRKMLDAMEQSLCFVDGYYLPLDFMDEAIASAKERLK